MHAAGKEAGRTGRAKPDYGARMIHGPCAPLNAGYLIRGSSLPPGFFMQAVARWLCTGDLGNIRPDPTPRSRGSGRLLQWDGPTSAVVHHQPLPNRRATANVEIMSTNPVARWPALFLPLILMLMLLVTGCATPAPETPPPEAADPLGMSNPRAEFTVTLQESTPPPLRIGQPVTLDLNSSADSYLNLYAIGTAGNTTQLLTNYPVRANEAVSFPPMTSKRFNYLPEPPPGKETFILVATRQPLRLMGRHDLKETRKPRTPVAALKLSGPQLLERLREALNRRPPSQWNAASLQLPLAGPH